MRSFTLILLFAALWLSPLAAFGEGQIPHAEEYSGPAWSPYVAGSLIGVLLWLTLMFSKKPVGASTSYATAAGLLVNVVAPGHTKSLRYYKDNPPKLEWEFLFIGATIIGAFLAAWHGDELTRNWLPPMWADRFGADSLAWRGLAGFAGGILMALGARLAGGCTSGHGISGTAQLNVGSWISLICFFIGGLLVANMLYRL
jgi:uncharacterized membrane protein YedE/YeeE